MTINKISLTNFCNISNAELDFSKNINFIFGQPASGKSAIFEAMLVSLSPHKRSSTYGEYVKQGEDKATIHLEVELFGNLAIFDTTINRVNGNACVRKLSYCGEEFEDDRVLDWLKRRSIDYNAKIMFAMQNEKNIVDQTPTDRLEYIQKLFNFNFNEKKKKLDADRKELEKSISEINATIAGNKTTIEHLSIEQKTENRKITEEQRVEYEKKIADQMDLIKANQAIFDKANAIKDEISLYNEDILKYSNAIMQEESIISAEAEKEKEIKTLTNEISDFEKLIKETTIELEDLKKDVDKWSIQKTEITENINEHITHRIEIETNIKNVKSKIDLVSQGKCPTCGQPTSELDNTLDEQLEKLSNELDREESEIEKLLLQQKEIDQSFTLAQTKFNTKNINLAGDNSSLSSKRNRLKSLQDREPVKHICDLDEVKSKKEEIVALQNAKKEELSQLKIIKSASDLLDEIEPFKKAINEDTIIIEKNALITKANAENKACCAELTVTNNKLLDSVLLLNNKVTTIKEAYEIVNKTLPQYISKTICERLENRINNFIHRIFPKFEVKLKTGEKGCDLLYTKDKTVIDEKRNKYLSAKMSSGLERSLLTLAFKVALAESYNLDVFVGDEIDQSSNDKDAKILMDMLINSKNFKQLFIISHKNAVLDHLTENYNGFIYQVDNGNFTKTSF
jgi:DNA repair exonuclease SbcCD ATPase subunit